MKTISLLFFAIIVAVLSCDKPVQEPQAEDPPVSLQEMTLCYNNLTWDSTSIASALPGVWDWEFIQCYGKPEDGNSKDFEGLQVEFVNDGSLTVKQNGETTLTSTWQIMKLNDGYFALKTTPLVIQLPGRILLCDQRVVFSDSYTDGCDNYFTK